MLKSLFQLFRREKIPTMSSENTIPDHQTPIEETKGSAPSPPPPKIESSERKEDTEREKLPKTLSTRKGKLKVVSYNILAATYCSASSFPYCPIKYLDFGYRSPRVVTHDIC
jgi:hypothetical protein